MTGDFADSSMVALAILAMVVRLRQVARLILKVVQTNRITRAKTGLAEILGEYSKLRPDQMGINPYHYGSHMIWRRKVAKFLERVFGPPFAVDFLTAAGTVEQDLHYLRELLSRADCRKVIAGRRRYRRAVETLRTFSTPDRIVLAGGPIHPDV